MSKLVFVSLTLVLALVGSRTVRADDLLVRRLDLLEQIVAQQQQELATFQTAGYTAGAAYTTGADDGSCGTCAKLYYDPASRRGGVYAAADLTFLRPYMGREGLDALLPAPTGPGGLEGEYTFAPRLIIGYEGASGLGVRTRYWFFDQDFGVAGVAPLFGIDMDVLDLEATIRKDFGSWDLQFAGGVRYGREEMSYNGDRLSFEGTGLTVAAEVTRPVYNGNWSLLGNFRGSLLYGETRDTGIIWTGTSANEIMQVWEIQLGVEYARETSAGQVAIQFLWEAQYWENAPIAAIMSDLGFSGPTLKVEFRR